MVVAYRNGRKYVKGRVVRKGRRRVQRPRKVLRRGKYADVHSMKLSAQSMYIASNGSSTGPVAQGSGIGIANPIQNSNGSTNSWWLSGAFGFQLANTLQKDQLVTLYDRYKINGVKLTFYPEWNTNQIQGGGMIPQIKIVHDYDDNSYPTPGDVWARQGKIYRLTRPFSVFVRPKVVVPVGASTGGNMCIRAPFLDCSNPLTTHFGLKFAVRDWYASGSNSTVSNQTLRVEATYYVTFRNQIRVGAPLPGTVLVDENGVLIPGPGLPQDMEEEDQPCEDK